jgi:raffinose/stachyose/melibiose transport system substrate-binding protein
MNRSWKTLAAIAAAAVTVLAGCTPSGAASPAASTAASTPAVGGSASADGSAAPTPAASNDHVLRIAMGSPGEAQIRVWDDVAKQFHAAQPDTKVEMNYQQDDLYETIGLQQLLAGRNAPDIYFEWTGERLRTRLNDGYAADISDAFRTGPLAGLFDDATLAQYTVDGKVVMVPYSADVTNVLWYNKKILADAGVQPPATWADLLAACDTLKGKGIIPIASGNKDLWPAGNWLGHMASRVVGEDLYAQTLSGTGKFSTPEWESAFGHIKELADHKCVNDTANSIDDNAGAQLFFQEKAAMHPIGSWLVSWALDEAPDLDFDYVNLPSMADGKGDQNSVIGVATGYVINAKSPKQKEAAEFMALLNNDANVKALIKAEVTPLAKSASAGEKIDTRSTKLTQLLNEAPAIVLPPDTGYDLKTADALYTAIAAVLGGKSSPADALAEMDRKLSR